MRIIYAAIILIVILFSVPFSYSNANNELRAIAGKIDLQMHNPSELIALKGEWVFYYNQLLQPEELQQNQPTALIP